MIGDKYYHNLRTKTDEELLELEKFHNTNWGSQRGCLCETAIEILTVIDRIRKERQNAIS